MLKNRRRGLACYQLSLLVAYVKTSGVHVSFTPGFSQVLIGRKVSGTVLTVSFQGTEIFLAWRVSTTDLETVKTVLESLRPGSPG
jgi:hypothetical protein